MGRVCLLPFVAEKSQKQRLRDWLCAWLEHKRLIVGWSMVLGTVANRLLFLSSANGVLLTEEAGES